MADLTPMAAGPSTQRCDVWRLRWFNFKNGIHVAMPLLQSISMDCFTINFYAERWVVYVVSTNLDLPVTDPVNCAQELKVAMRALGFEPKKEEVRT